MKFSLELDGRHWQVQHQKAQGISIPLYFQRSQKGSAQDQETLNQPVHFDAPPAQAFPYQCDGFVGKITEGGSCNVEQLSFTPHCNGTHTETRRHISDEGKTITEIAENKGAWLVPSTLISLSPVLGQHCEESYEPALCDGDWVITKASLEAQCTEVGDALLQALVIRTLPNSIVKKSRHYTAQASPPFLTLDAAQYLVARGVQHLLVDVPSVDRYFDEGKLSVHHIFFAPNRPNATITELIYVSDQLADGPYLLNLQCPSFDTDAAPSRPVLIPLLEVKSDA